MDPHDVDQPSTLPTDEQVVELYRKLGIASPEGRELANFDWIPSEGTSVAYPFANQVTNSSRPLEIRSA